MLLLGLALPFTPTLHIPLTPIGLVVFYWVVAGRMPTQGLMYIHGLAATGKLRVELLGQHSSLS